MFEVIFLFPRWDMLIPWRVSELVRLVQGGGRFPWCLEIPLVKPIEFPTLKPLMKRGDRKTMENTGHFHGRMCFFLGEKLPCLLHKNNQGLLRILSANRYRKLMNVDMSACKQAMHLGKLWKHDMGSYSHGGVYFRWLFLFNRCYCFFPNSIWGAITTVWLRVNSRGVSMVWNPCAKSKG